MERDELLLVRLYEALLKKYKDLINEQEKKTVRQVKSMVDSDDLTVQMLIDKFRENNDEPAMQTFEKIYEFLKNEIDFIKIEWDLNYWFSPREILTNKICDDEDISVLICSILVGLGMEKSWVVINLLEDYKTHAFVITETDESTMIIDMMQKLPLKTFCGEKEKVLQEYNYQGEKIKKFIYKFNNKEYEQF